MSSVPSRSSPFSGPIVALTNPAGAGPIVLVCEHAAPFIPPEFDGLGLEEAALASHIAWDVGALGVAEALSDRLDATLLSATVSRLVYDCNRAPDSDTAIPTRSEDTDIPGNRNLSDHERLTRVERFYLPFRTALTGLLDHRTDQRQPSVLVTIHSFTPIFHGRHRAVDIGILHDADTRLADPLLDACAAAPCPDGRTVPLTVRRNEPYGPENGVTHTLREHALPRGLLNVMIEIRNDLIGDAPAQQRFGDWLAARLMTALAPLPVGP